MTADEEAVVRRNQEINDAEIRGDVAALHNYVASELAFRRRNGTIVCRHAFLKPNPGERTMEVESVRVYGNRAVVTCMVKNSDGKTHNIRLFVEEGGEWRVLGWANEPA